MRARNRRSIYIADEQWAVLAELAKKADVSVAHLVRRYIGAGLVADGESDLVPEQVGPDIRTTDEPVLPALKRTGGSFHPMPTERKP